MSLSAPGVIPVLTSLPNTSSPVPTLAARCMMGRGAVPFPVTQGWFNAPTTSNRREGSYGATRLRTDQQHIKQIGIKNWQV
jgi:hypothetical protein